jgi:hypothetical protein
VLFENMTILPYLKNYDNCFVSFIGQKKKLLFIKAFIAGSLGNNFVNVFSILCHRFTSAF